MIYHLPGAVNICGLTPESDRDMIKTMKGLHQGLTGKGDCVMTVREVLAA